MRVQLGPAVLLFNFILLINLRPDLGVDLFFMLFAFLMVRQYQIQQDRKPSKNPTNFLHLSICHFFRIAQFSYILLAVALILGLYICTIPVALGIFLGRAPQLLLHYMGASRANIVMHVSFCSGYRRHSAFAHRCSTGASGWKCNSAWPFFFLMLRMGLAWQRVGAIIVVAGALIVATALQHAHVGFFLPAYLIHLLITYPLGTFLVTHGTGDFPPISLFAMVAIVTLIPTYALSMLIYWFIERPGQQVGRIMLNPMASVLVSR